MICMKRGAWAGLRAAALPLSGLALIYAIFALTPWGRRFDVLASHGRWAAGWKVRRADLALLETMSAVTVAIALLVLILIAVSRGRWQLGLRAAMAVAGALASAEMLKHLLPSLQPWTGDWRWLTAGSFPSGHSVIVTSLALATLTICSDRWRHILAGPLVAWTAVAITGTVTLGWHRPSDVIGSLFLATAWHRACSLKRPAGHRLASVLHRSAHPARMSGLIDRVPNPSALAWWALACLLVVGAAADGIIDTGTTATWQEPGPGRVTALAYVVALGLLVMGAGLTVLGPNVPHREPSRPPDPSANRS